MSGYELAFIGLLVSLGFIALTGIYPGGIIVPGYLALFMDQPLRLAGTLIVALLTVLTYKLVSRFMILFGKRRFVFMILAGGVWTFIWLAVLPHLFPVSPEFRVIGWVVPGLIANHFERQGVALTLASLVIVTVIIWLIGLLF